MALIRPKLTLYRDPYGDWRWRLQARNGRIVAASEEGFSRRPRAQAKGERVARATYGDFEVVVA
jgi:uncharacterized protein YegP (UPF0339 family)